MTLYTFILIVLTMACWHVLKSAALWERHSKHRLHHFPRWWPGRLEFIIIGAVVEGNKSVLLFRKRPVICFVPPFALTTSPTWGEQSEDEDEDGTAPFVGRATSKHRQTIGTDDPFGPGAAPSPKRTRPLTRSLASKMGEVWDRSPGWSSLHLAVGYRRNRQAGEERAHPGSQAVTLHC